MNLLTLRLLLSKTFAYPHNEMCAFWLPCRRWSHGLDFRTYESFKAGGEHGPVFIPGNAEESEVVEQIVSGAMPPDGPPLTDAEIQLFINWINQQETQDAAIQHEHGDEDVDGDMEDDHGDEEDADGDHDDDDGDDHDDGDDNGHGDDDDHDDDNDN